jgi:hypothetical protein
MAEFDDRPRIEAQHLRVSGEVVVEKIAPFAEAGVVDQEVDREASLGNLVKEPLGSALGGEVERDNLDLKSMRGAEFSAKASSRSFDLATRTRFDPRAARSAAIALPIPDEAPVTSDNLPE